MQFGHGQLIKALDTNLVKRAGSSPVVGSNRFTPRSLARSLQVMAEPQPLPSGYYPLDSAAPAFFRLVGANNYSTRE
jgi:hypothetical protein